MSAKVALFFSAINRASSVSSGVRRISLAPGNRQHAARSQHEFSHFGRRFNVANSLHHGSGRHWVSRFKMDAAALGWEVNQPALLDVQPSPEKKKKPVRMLLLPWPVRPAGEPRFHHDASPGMPWDQTEPVREAGFFLCADPDHYCLRRFHSGITDGERRGSDKTKSAVALCYPPLFG